MNGTLQNMNSTLRDMNGKYVAEIKSEDSRNSVVGHKINVVFSLRGKNVRYQTKSHIVNLDKNCVIYKEMSNSN